ncbi:hypothetical protein AGDE_14852 [Angomonas deanei]|nr:hypothetical protein AGDE_14852 [Angomonas deanei]|eukprot:EPY20116.1 hypothetical protein AGDE_14852 [Angomonas deanei]
MWGPAQGHHSEREAVQLAQPQEGLEPSPAEYPRWTSWAKSNVKISDEQREALLQCVPGPVKQPTVCPADDAAAHLTPAQTLTLELKEKERLEGEVDLLAVQLKQLLSSRVAKSKNKQ